MGCTEWRWRRSWPHSAAVLTALMVGLFVAWVGIGSATPADPPPCPATAEPTSSGTTSSGTTSSGADPSPCPAGATCLPAHTERDGRQITGIFVVLDESIPAPTTTTAKEAPQTTTTTAAPKRTATTTMTKAAPRRTATTTTAPTPRAVPRKSAAPELPGAIDVDEAQRQAEACGVGYGCPLPAPERATGVVPAPGCSGANAQAPDGRCGQ